MKVVAAAVSVEKCEEPADGLLVVGEERDRVEGVVVQHEA